MFISLVQFHFSWTKSLQNAEFDIFGISKMPFSNPHFGV